LPASRLTNYSAVSQVTYAVTSGNRAYLGHHLEEAQDGEGNCPEDAVVLVVLEADIEEEVNELLKDGLALQEHCVDLLLGLKAHVELLNTEVADVSDDGIHAEHQRVLLERLAGRAGALLLCECVHEALCDQHKVNQVVHGEADEQQLQEALGHYLHILNEQQRQLRIFEDVGKDQEL